MDNDDNVWGEEIPVDWTVYVTADGRVVPRTWASLEAEDMPWSALDNEELARGQLRDRRGSFSGTGPSLIPRGLVREQRVRTAERAQDINMAVLPAAMQTRVDLMMNPAVDSAVRLRAAMYAEERAIGKIPEKVETTLAVKPWEGIVEGILVDAPALE